MTQKQIEDAYFKKVQQADSVNPDFNKFRKGLGVLFVNQYTTKPVSFSVVLKKYGKNADMLEVYDFQNKMHTNTQWTFDHVEMVNQYRIGGITKKNLKNPTEISLEFPEWFL